MRPVPACGAAYCRALPGERLQNTLQGLKAACRACNGQVSNESRLRRLPACGTQPQQPQPQLRRSLLVGGALHPKGRSVHLALHAYSRPLGAVVNDVS